MHILPRDKQISVLSALLEGCSIRATERLTNVHRDTIMRLGLKAGLQAERLHDDLFKNLNVAAVEIDEMWSYVGQKEHRLTVTSEERGDQYLFLGLGASSKAIISYRVGKRDMENTELFIQNLRSRVLNRPHISSDGFGPYVASIEKVFGCDVHYGQIVKHYNSSRHIEKVSKRTIFGSPDDIATTTVERSNLTFRMQVRRLARRTNGFSKKLCNHKAAISLFIAYYNLCRIHQSLRMTPAMALGVTDRVWSVGDLL